MSLLIFTPLSQYPIASALILDFIEGAVGVPPFSSSSGTSAQSECSRCDRITQLYILQSYTHHAKMLL